MYPRYVTSRLKESLSDTPVVFLMGPRQAGKTTLVKSLAGNDCTYVTLDDLTQLQLAKADPVGFIRHMSHRLVILDEVQRIPELFLSIKQSVDEDRAPGRFLLTGSANALLLPNLADSLAGRIEAITLNTLSECEIKGRAPYFLGALLSGDVPSATEHRLRDALFDRVLRGCFAEPLQRSSISRATAWYTAYTQSLILKDIRDLADIEHPELVGKLLNSTAFFSGKLLNITELGGKLGLARNTIKQYLSLLQQMFLINFLPAWHCNEYKRLIKTPKLHVLDTGIISALRGFNEHTLSKHPEHYGQLLESFVYSELCKQAEWEAQPLSFYHFRDKDKKEVDIVIEDVMGDCFGIEVKASATISTSDFAGLKRFKEVCGKRFKKGLLLYDGDHVTPFGEDLYAVPIGALWREAP